MLFNFVYKNKSLLRPYFSQKFPPQFFSGFNFSISAKICFVETLFKGSDKLPITGRHPTIFLHNQSPKRILSVYHYVIAANAKQSLWCGVMLSLFCVTLNLFQGLSRCEALIFNSLSLRKNDGVYFIQSPVTG